MNEVEQLKETVSEIMSGWTIFHRQQAMKRFHKLLDGVTGFTREGDVVFRASDLDRIREALLQQPCSFVARGDYNDCARAGGGRGAKDPWCARCAALALLDGAVGLTRPGDVVLSAEQVRDARLLLRKARRRWCGVEECPHFSCRALDLVDAALLASEQQGEEQA